MIKCFACGNQINYNDEISISLNGVSADLHPICAINLINDISGELTEYLTSFQDDRINILDRMYAGVDDSETDLYS